MDQITKMQVGQTTVFQNISLNGHGGDFSDVGLYIIEQEKME